MMKRGELALLADDSGARDGGGDDDGGTDELG